MTEAEQAIAFQCRGEALLGIVHPTTGGGRDGVLIVVGGPQYRVGSHRQFLLLARYLADNGVPVFRFDYRGMGDSGGESISFEQCSPDIAAAIDTFVAVQPSIERVAIWGLCDAASAALLYAHTDPRVSGVCLLNPWVRSEAGLAKAYLKRYYLAHLLDRDLWKRVFTGRFPLLQALRALGENLRDAASPRTADESADRHFVDGMLAGLRAFQGRVLLILSGDDITAAEFDQLVRADREWRRALNDRRVRIRRLPESNHTFSSAAWRDQVARWTREWVDQS